MSARSPRLWAFPIIVVTALVMLIAGNVNGSSVGVLDGQDHSAEGFFRPQMIRADEWSNATPLAVGLTRQGFPERPFVGLTQTDVNVITPAMPSRTWDQAFRVQNLGFQVLGVERGVAMQWWLPVAVSLIGVYLLLLVLTGSLATSIGLSMVATFAPTTAWWSNWPTFAIGWLSLSVALILLALRAERSRSTVLLSLAAGYSAVCAVLALYPPWLLSCALVCAGLLLGLLWDTRPGLRRMALAIGPAVGVAAAFSLAFVLSNATAFQAMTGTIYPGQRQAASGEGHITWLMNAASSPLIAYGKSVSGSNASELSSPWFPGPLLVVAVAYLILVAWRRPAVTTVRGIALGRGVTVGLVTAGAVLAVWAFVPGVPALVGKVLLLSNVPGFRVVVALGLWAVLVLAVVIAVVSERGLTTGWRIAFLAGAALTVVGMTVSALRSLQGIGPVSVALIAAMSTVFAAGCVLLVWGWRAAGATILSLLALGSYAVVNPVAVGLGPLINDELALRLRALAVEAPRSSIAIFGVSAAEPMAKAAGLQVLNGQTLYPDRPFWEGIAPEDEALWNNYRNYAWMFEETGPAVEGEITQQDGATLDVNVCAADLRDYTGIDWVLAPVGDDPPCGELVDTFGWRGVYGLNIYRIG